MARYGLIGKNIDYSFSKAYFTSKFEKEKRRDTYQNFDLEHIDLLPDIVAQYPDAKGFNVTIPYKESVMELLDRIDKEALEIGAVNTIKKLKDGRLAGYNTDHYGFAKSLADFLPLEAKTGLVLGTGGAAKAVRYVLKAMGFEYLSVSRQKTEETITYKELTPEIMASHFLIVNCTPLGTYPNVDECPSIPYQQITDKHFLFDLIYNPSETEFLKRGFAKGAKVCNGLKMLEYQAEKAWTIWKS
ncbi:shikimate dehydrogenase [Aureisphaera galaxeae]|uniref:shikimate dehydrogenase family protein n=1 Tax=Aureisphaera galaxeae TaxID=1538023 RepID=UPI0023500597|nr:shikimate dehydrogenase [Aureisphaera galaxeae]MDC8003451.1 shikimate dehydrogenase [Aureisphaera galaxeae]